MAGNEITIRQCTEDDFSAVRGLIDALYEEEIFTFGLKIDSDSVMRAVRGNFKEAFVMVVKNEIVGIIAWQIVKIVLIGKNICQETLWYIKPNYRIYASMLIKSLENHCQERGITEIIMTQMTGLDDDLKSRRLKKFYNRLGYQLLETHYIKTIRT